jgi:hypothetical protein
MWQSYHIWTEIYLDNPPQGDDHWYVDDCCDEYIPGHTGSEKHIEGSIDPRVDYYRSYKVLNGLGSGSTNAIGNEIYTSPLTWNVGWLPPNNFPPTVNKDTLINVKNYYIRDNYHIVIETSTTTGHLLRNDYDCYKIPKDIGYDHYISFSLSYISGIWGDPATDGTSPDATIWVSISNYPQTEPTSHIHVGEQYLLTNLGYNDYYIVIYPGVNSPWEANQAQPTGQEGNCYQYTIQLP